MAQLPGTGYTSQTQYNPTVRRAEDFSAQISAAQQQTQNRSRLRGAIQQAGNQLSSVAERITRAVGEQKLFQEKLRVDREREKVMDSVTQYMMGASDPAAGPQGFQTAGVHQFEEAAGDVYRFDKAQEIYEKEMERVWENSPLRKGLFSGQARNEFEQIKQQGWHRVRDAQQEIGRQRATHEFETSFKGAIESGDPQNVIDAVNRARDSGVIAPWKADDLRIQGLNTLSYQAFSEFVIGEARMGRIGEALDMAVVPDEMAIERAQELVDAGLIEEANDIIGEGLYTFQDPETGRHHLLKKEQIENVRKEVIRIRDEELIGEKTSLFKGFSTQIQTGMRNGTLQTEGQINWMAQQIAQHTELLGPSNWHETDYLNRLYNMLDDVEAGRALESEFENTVKYQQVLALMGAGHLPEDAAINGIEEIKLGVTDPELREALVELSNDSSQWAKRTDTAKQFDGLIQDTFEDAIRQAREDGNEEFAQRLADHQADAYRNSVNFLLDESNFVEKNGQIVGYDQDAAAELAHSIRGNYTDPFFLNMIEDPRGAVENTNMGLVVEGRFLQGKKRDRALRLLRRAGMMETATPMRTAEFTRELGQELVDVFTQEMGASSMRVGTRRFRDGRVFIAPRVDSSAFRGAGLDEYLYERSDTGSRHHLIKLHPFPDGEGGETWDWAIANIAASGTDGDFAWEPIPAEIRSRMDNYPGFTPLPDRGSAMDNPRPSRPESDVFARGDERFSNFTDDDLRAAGYTQDEIDEIRGRGSRPQTGGRGGFTR